MKIGFVILFVLFFACSMTEPSTLIIKNNSNYNIEVRLTNSSTDKLILQKNKGEVVYTSAGKVELTVIIDEIRYKNEYSVNMSLFDKKKFEFSMN